MFNVTPHSVQISKYITFARSSYLTELISIIFQPLFNMWNYGLIFVQRECQSDNVNQEFIFPIFSLM